MGIKGLKGIIKKYAPSSIYEINAKELKGKKICIDSSILLYKFRYIYRDDNFHILGFLSKIIELLENNVKAIFVFDGKPPDAKKETLAGRADNRNKMKDRLAELLEAKKALPEEEYIDSDDEQGDNEGIVKLMNINKEIEKINRNNLVVTRKHSLEVMEMLKSLGIPFLHADGEAEEYCAFLQKRDVVDYLLTEDTDSLTFGATKVLFNNKKNYSICILENVLSSMGISYLQFVDFCILCGCDYTCTIPKIGPVNALKIIKKYKLIDTFLSIDNKHIIPEKFNFEF